MVHIGVLLFDPSESLLEDERVLLFIVIPLDPPGDDVSDDQLLSPLLKQFADLCPIFADVL